MKLYVASILHEVVFCSDERGFELEGEAEHFMEEQDKTFQPKLVIREITQESEIPKDWQGDALIWGDDSEITASHFFKQHVDSEYQEYLRLKTKYENKKRK
jgi:hypothetical protein